jgi:ribosomal protein S18 acetylase RimI-like enzyme
MALTPIQIDTRTLELADLSAVATIHMLAFRDSAVTRLGHQATRRYYEWQLIGPHDVAALGAFRGDRLAGFCFGGVFRGAMSGFLRKHRAFLAMRVLTHPWLVLNPVFRDRLALGTRLSRQRVEVGKPTSTLTSPKESATPKSFGNHTIAVDPRQQGLGVGKVLMSECEVIARQSGFRQMGLTVQPANHQAIRLYERLGWERVVKDGAWSGSMSKQLDPESNA